MGIATDLRGRGCSAAAERFRRSNGKNMMKHAIRHAFSKLASMKTMLFLHGLAVLSICLVIYAAVKGNSITYEQSGNYDNHLRYLIANALFRQGTDLLTDAVRRYAITMNPEFMDRYFHEAREAKHRDRALDIVNDLQIDQSLKNTLTQAMGMSKALMDIEYHAMHLIAQKSGMEPLYKEVGDYPLTPEERNLSLEQCHERAEELLWGKAYIESKTKIYARLSNGLRLVSSQAEARQWGLREELIRTLSIGAVGLTFLVLALLGIILYRHYQHEQMILKAEKARSYFFSTVSHDIRTPLNSIIGFSEMLQLGIDEPEEREKALDAIVTSAQTLLELINDVLDLSKLESGKMELHPVPTDITQLVSKVAASFEVATSRTSVPLRMKVEKMPLLKLDPQRIRQILFNLIGNAVKFTAKGSITVRASYDDHTFILSVEDTGCGIPAENIGRLMSPYVQLQEHDSTKGTGLGLAICKQLALQMKGKLELVSTLGKGSTFTLRIPKVQAFSEKESEAFFEVNKPPQTVTQLDRSILEKRILIVDDQRLNLRILQTMLIRIGFRKVLTAENGKEALEVLQKDGNVDIVLTDMSMPVMDGSELVREMRRQPPFAGIPVYVITADVEVQTDYREIGFDDMLIKPITLEKLKALLAKYAPHRSTDTTA